MKLQSLNCPNCGSILVQEGDSMVCKSCGSAFAIDYDDSDVEYEKAANEVERLQQEHEHAKEMLEKEFELKEQAEIRRAKRIRADARKSALSSSVVNLIKSLISLAVLVAIGFGLYKFMSSNITREKIKKAVETTTTANPYALTVKDIQNDTFFMENAVASVYSAVHNDKDDKNIKFYSSGDWDEWKIKSGPEITDLYFLGAEKDNRLYFFIKTVYKCKGKKDEVVYNAYYFRKLTIDADGKIKCDYQIWEDSGSSSNWNWGGQSDKDQMYREVILGNTKYTAEKFEVSADQLKDPKKTAKETEETTTETEQTEETTKKKKKKKS